MSICAAIADSNQVRLPRTPEFAYGAYTCTGIEVNDIAKTRQKLVKTKLTQSSPPHRRKASGRWRARAVNVAIDAAEAGVTKIFIPR